jgi:copper resistance protein C
MSSDQGARVRCRNACRFVIGGALLSSCLIFAAPSGAHCWPVEQMPAAGAVLDSSPREVRIRFSEAVQLTASQIYLDRIDGQRIKTTLSKNSDGEAGVLAISLPELVPGRYRVLWTAVTFDGHTSEGDYGFKLHEPIASLWQRQLEIPWGVGSPGKKASTVTVMASHSSRRGRRAYKIDRSIGSLVVFYRFPNPSECHATTDVEQSDLDGDWMIRNG